MDKNLESDKLASEALEPKDLNTSIQESPAIENSEESEKNSESSKKKLEELTKNELIEKLKDLRFQEEVPLRQEVDAIRHIYYTMRQAETNEEKSKFEENAPENEIFVPSIDPSDDVVKEYLSKIKEKRAKKIAEEEKIKEKNYQKKIEIINAVKELTESSEDFNKLFKQFKDYQNKWKEIGAVPQANHNKLWTDYQTQIEKFYDLVKINDELRDYDFKKNLEQKNVIIEAGNKLLEETDVILAFRQLQRLHQQWREIGPVEKEIREPLWTKFKEVSAQINKNYQDYFEKTQEQEDNNLTAKQTIIEKLKGIDYDQIKTFRDWEKATSEVIKLQDEWKKLGFVPRRLNHTIFEEFRGLCDIFFQRKGIYFDDAKSEMEQNLLLKQDLAKQATALKDSTDWNKTTKIFVKIQREWKSIGPVPRKYSESIWKEFVEACDYFFEQKKKLHSSQRDIEIENYKAKKAVIEKIKEIEKTLETSELLEQLRQLQDEWHKIGYVPFKDKDRSYKELYAAVDAHYDRVKINKNERRFQEFKSQVEDKVASNDANAERTLSKERDYLTYQYNKIKADLQVYENNMNFLTLSSKGKDNPLLKDVNKKVEALRTELSLLEKKILTLESNLESFD